MRGPLVVIRTYGRALDAQIARSRLQASGIPCFLPDEQLSTIDPLLTDALGGVRLQVADEDAERAREILDQPLDLSEDLDPEHGCPHCESPYWSESWSPWQIIGGVALLGIPFRFMKRRCVCQRCEGSWGSEEERQKLLPGGASLALGDGLPASYRDAHPPAAILVRPVFRLRRTRAAAGAFWGLVGMWLVSVLLGPGSGPLVLLGLIVGGLVGRSQVRYLCSEPACRRPVGPQRATCPGCKSPVVGLIDRPAQHYRDRASWLRAEQERQGREQRRQLRAGS
jgi:hypothetical protein